MLCSHLTTLFNFVDISRLKQYPGTHTINKNDLSLLVGDPNAMYFFNVRISEVSNLATPNIIF